MRNMIREVPGRKAEALTQGLDNAVTVPTMFGTDTGPHFTSHCCNAAVMSRKDETHQTPNPWAGWQGTWDRGHPGRSIRNLWCGIKRMLPHFGLRCPPEGGRQVRPSLQNCDVTMITIRYRSTKNHGGFSPTGRTVSLPARANLPGQERGGAPARTKKPGNKCLRQGGARDSQPAADRQGLGPSTAARW